MITQKRLTDGTSPGFPLAEGEVAGMLEQREVRRNREFSPRPPLLYFPTFASPVKLTCMIQQGAVNRVPTRSLICSPLPMKPDTASDDRPTSNSKVNSSTDAVLSATAVGMSTQITEE